MAGRCATRCGGERHLCQNLGHVSNVAEQTCAEKADCPEYPVSSRLGDVPTRLRDGGPLRDQQEHPYADDQYRHLDVQAEMAGLPKHREQAGQQEERPEHDADLVETFTEHEGQDADDSQSQYPDPIDACGEPCALNNQPTPTAMIRMGITSGALLLDDIAFLRAEEESRTWLLAVRSYQNRCPPAGPVSGTCAVTRSRKKRDIHLADECPLLMSGRLDSNQRPHGPEPCALAKLSYAPWFLYRNGAVQIVNRNGSRTA
jgi:hypothetical protein